MLQRGNFQEHHTSILQTKGFPWFYKTDASKKGLGAVILQNSKPVMFASRALTGSERNYQNLERECVATIWEMEKIHYFLYGKEFILEMDQKPLVSIYSKHMVEISKDPEVSSQQLSIPNLQCAIRERCGNSTSWCTKLCYTITHGRGWNSAANHSSKCGDSEHSIQFQCIW